MLHTLIKFNPRDVPLRVALRNALAVVLPLAIGVATGHVDAGLGVATGALNAMFTDQPGPYRLRAYRMLLSAAAAALSALIGSLVGGNAVLIVLASLLWGVGGGLLVALGPDAARAGLTSMILLVIMGAEPHAVPEAWPAAALIFAGGVLQTLFAIAAWPLQRYRPERLALAAAFRGLADFAQAEIGHGDTVALPPSLNDVQALMFGAGRARGRAVEAFRVLAELAERIRLELFALAHQQSQCEIPEVRSILARSRVAAVAWIAPSNPASISLGSRPEWSMWAWVSRTASTLAASNGNGS